MKYILFAIVLFFLFKHLKRISDLGEVYIKSQTQTQCEDVKPKKHPKYKKGLLVYNPDRFTRSEDNIAFCADPSDIIGKTDTHVGELQWEDENGVYEAVKCTNNLKEVVMYHNFYTYHPKRCQVCGAIIDYEPPIHPNTRNKVDTGAAPDSESRFCSKCRERFTHNTEAYYPFFIDTVNQKIITYEDKEEFTEYMKTCSLLNIKDEELKRLGYGEISKAYDVLLRCSTQIEYIKNQHVADNWLRFQAFN